MMEWKVPLADLDYGPEEEEAVLKVLRSRWLTMGAVAQEFEAQFARLVGARHALAVGNATQALHLACLGLGIGPGDEVIVPALSFVATANAVLYTGGSVRFADITSLEEPTLAPGEIERLANEHTRAVIVMHYGGYPCRMVEIMEAATRHGLMVIEDAAHAPGGALDGIALGTWGEAGCFSFFSNKNLATGEGGMLVTDRDQVAERVRKMRSHGMTSLTWERHKGHAHSYDVTELGYNYRIDEVRSALGLVQLGKLGDNNGKRKKLTEAYWQELESSGLGLPFRARALEEGVQPAWHIFPALLPDKVQRDVFMEHMRSAGVQCSIHYPPIHEFSFYRRLFGEVELPVTQEFARREVTLPLYAGMDEKALKLVVESVCKALQAQATRQG